MVGEALYEHIRRLRLERAALRLKNRRAQVAPGGEFARAIHEGPYETLHETYARLCGEWLPAQGREIRDAPSVEVYLNDPAIPLPRR